jgi:hypothetical protein
MLILKRYKELMCVDIRAKNLPIYGGILLATACCTKVTTIPMFSVVFFLWQGRKDKNAFLGGFAFSLMLFLLPIINNIKNMAQWYYNLFIHAGIYGDGEKQIVDFSRFIHAIITIFDENLMFMLVLPISFILLILHKKKNADFIWKISLLLFSAISLSIIVVAKHYHVHYLITVFPFINLLYYFVARLNEGKWSSIFFIIFCGLTIFTSVNYYNFYCAEILRLNTYKENALTSLQSFKKRYPTEAVVTSYRASSPVYALQFGNEFAKFRYARKLSIIFPNTVSYNIWSRQYCLDFGLSTLSAWKDSFIIQGSHCYHSEYRILYKSIEEIADFNDEKIARVKMK